MITLVSSPKQHLPKHMQHSVFAVVTAFWVISFPFSFPFPFLFKSIYLYLVPIISFFSFSTLMSRFFKKSLWIVSGHTPIFAVVTTVWIISFPPFSFPLLFFFSFLLSILVKIWKRYGLCGQRPFSIKSEYDLDSHSYICAFRVISFLYFPVFSFPFSFFLSFFLFSFFFPSTSFSFFTLS